MCATDLELELDGDITEDEQMPDEIIGQHPGVAWGRAGRRDQDPAEAGPGAGTR
jgi:hypothetical protein